MTKREILNGSPITPHPFYSVSCGNDKEAYSGESAEEARKAFIGLCALGVTPCGLWGSEWAGSSSFSLIAQG